VSAQSKQSARLFLQSSELTAPPPRPLTHKRMCLSPYLGPKGGEQHLLAGEGVGGAIRTNEQKAWHSVYSVLYVNIGHLR
jgi:hypothetical protein